MATGLPCDAAGCINIGGNTRRAVEALGESNRTLEPHDSGKIFTVGAYTVSVTLPTVGVAGNGWFVEFWVNDNSAATTITAPGTDLIIGHVVTGADNNNRQLNPATVIDTEVVTLTTSAVKGDWVRLFCDGTNYFISGDSRVNNGITCAAE
mgnify:CR=1 FL=1